MKTAITNITTIVTGDWRKPFAKGDAILMNKGKITKVGTVSAADLKGCDVVLDGGGMTAIPGLIDSQVHVAFADYTPVISSPERYQEALKRIGLPDGASNLHKDRELLGPRRAVVIATYAEELVEAERDVEAVTFGMRNMATLTANMIGAAFDAVDRKS